MISCVPAEEQHSSPVSLVPPSPKLKTPEYKRKLRRRSRRDLKYMVGDGFFFSLMVGLGETYLPAFVLAMGLGEVAAGLIASLPMLAGAILQLLTPLATRKLGSHKRWILLCATIQSLSFVPLVIAAWVGKISTPAVFAVAAIYWGFGMATGPAWNTWAEAIVPRLIRSKYFAGRTRFAQTGVFLGFVAGGCLLQSARSGGWVQTGFAILFLVAGTCRFLSVLCLSRQTEAPMQLHSHRNVSLGELVNRIRRGGSERLLVYLISVQFAVYISGPYFNPFMLKQLGFSYQTYMTLVAASFLAKALAMPLISVVAHSVLAPAGCCGLELRGWFPQQYVDYLAVVRILDDRPVDRQDFLSV
ncbi:MAG: MFS transporter [Planctomycetales bacterium]